MIIDSLLQVSDAQAVTTDAVSTNTIDLGNVTPKNQTGDGEPMGFTISVDVAADHTTGDETYTFELIQSANADLSSPDILASITVAAATLAAGYKFFLPLPPNQPTKRYLGVNYNTGGTTPSVTVTAEFGPQSFYNAKTPQNYASGFDIS